MLRIRFGLVMLLCLTSCTVRLEPRFRVSGQNPIQNGRFICITPQSEACLDNIHYSCALQGEFVSPVEENCTDQGLTCVPNGINGVWCLECVPDTTRCAGDSVERCRPDGSGWDLVETCDFAIGQGCRAGECGDLCVFNEGEQTYTGCEFYAVDLDNIAISAGRNASAQQYAVVVSNPNDVATRIRVEINRAPYGEDPVVETIQEVTIPPRDLEIFRLPRREVDGSSSFLPCSSDDPCQAGESCFCQGGAVPPASTENCFCRNAPLADGVDDGTYSALTSNAYRIRSDRPVIAYQFNPLDNFGVFSNDASLLLPVNALTGEYTVNSWPQTIADSTDPEEDFDPSTTNEDSRTFLTIVGTRAATQVEVSLGPQVRRVVGIAGNPDLGPGDELSLTVGPFDVINLETQGFNADFTGTRVLADGAVTVFVGSEASDAPRFTTLSDRQCCADHLEEQLMPDVTLGTRFFIGRTPPRSPALNNAFIETDSVGEPNELEYVRILAVAPGGTAVVTTLPAPFDSFELAGGEDIILDAPQDFEILSSEPISVLQILPSQGAVGIPSRYPGGDPSIIVVPPVAQYRDNYVFLTPQYYAFDFVTLVAPRGTQMLLDGNLLTSGQCSVAPADGVARRADEPQSEYLVYRCQLSYPDVEGRPTIRVLDGLQDDGYHSLVATRPISLVVSGWDAYVSYGYAGGLDLRPLVR